MLNFGNKEFRNLQEQVLKNAQDIEILKEKPNLSISIVDELPEVGQEGILYLVPKNPDPDTGDADSYDEYVWLPESESFELVGTTGIDLQNLSSPIYVTTSNKPEGLTYGLSIINNGWTSEIQQEGGTNILLAGTYVKTNNVEIDGRINFGNNFVNGSYIDTDPYSGIRVYSNGVKAATFYDNAVYIDTSLLPNTLTGNLGDSSHKWKDLYLLGQINFSTGPVIKQDSANRIVITGDNGQDRIKIGGTDSTYCGASWTPDQDGLYNLGTDTRRWDKLNVAKVQNLYSSLNLIGNPGITVQGTITPSTNNSYKIGSELARFNTVFTTTISNATDYINVADIAKKPNYTNPDVFASGTLNTNGEGTIDMSVTGMPSDGLYMFTYGNAQCFIALTSTMIQNAIQYPMRCPCPLLLNGSGYPGNLRIDRNADILTLKVASSGIGVAAPSGMGWQLIKVM